MNDPQCPVCGCQNLLPKGKEYDYDDANGGYEHEMVECAACGCSFSASEKFLGYADNPYLSDSPPNI